MHLYDIKSFYKIHVINIRLLGFEYSYVVLLIIHSFLVEGDPKAHFSIATTPKCKRGTSLFPLLLHLYLDTYLIMLSIKQSGIKYYFVSFGMTRPGIEPLIPGGLANILLFRPMAW